MNRRKKTRSKRNEDNIDQRNSKEEIGCIEGMEDTTKYGEFISSYFAWLTPEVQKRKANEIEDITGKKD